METDPKNIKLAFIVSHTYHSPQWEWFLNELKNYYKIYFFIIINKNEIHKCILYENLKNLGIDVYLIKINTKFSILIAIFKLIIFLIKNKIDIVQTEMPRGNLIGLTASYLCGIKRIMTASNVTWYKDFNSKKQFIIDKLSYKLSNKIICQANSSLEVLVNNFKVPKNKIEVINHAIKTDAYSNISTERINQLKKKFNIKPNDFIFGMIARLENWKGHEYAIKAMKNVIDKYPNAKLMIFGEGPEKENLIKLIKELNLENNIFLCGFETDIFAVYKLFDVQIHVPIDPYCETFGITIIDAMMMGKPLILTLSGIATEIAKDYENCIVVPYKDNNSISSKMLELIENENLREYLGNNAKRTAITHFSIENKVNKHILLYKSLLQEN